MAVCDLFIFHTKEKEEKFGGSHGGLTEDEMATPLIVVDGDKRLRNGIKRLKGGQCEGKNYKSIR